MTVMRVLLIYLGLQALDYAKMIVLQSARECLESDEQKNQFIILSLNWNEALVKVIQRLCFMNELKRINIMNFIVHVSTINKKGTMKI